MNSQQLLRSKMKLSNFASIMAFVLVSAFALSPLALLVIPVASKKPHVSATEMTQKPARSPDTSPSPSDSIDNSLSAGR